MKTLTKILGLSVISLGIFGATNCDQTKNDCPEGMEKVSITKHGISDYIWYKDVLGQDYIPKREY
jgi:hypothetical protein